WMAMRVTFILARRTDLLGRQIARQWASTCCERFSPLYGCHGVRPQRARTTLLVDGILTEKLAGRCAIHQSRPLCIVGIAEMHSHSLERDTRVPLACRLVPGDALVPASAARRTASVL